MSKELPDSLSRRERQIMDIIYRKGPISGMEVMRELPDSSSYSAVRTFLRILERKGYLKHKEEGAKYIYSPTITHEKAKRSALKRVLQTFFDGSVEQAVATLFDVSDTSLSKNELSRLAQRIQEARVKGE